MRSSWPRREPDGETLTGGLLNQPNELRNVNAGDRVSFDALMAPDDRGWTLLHDLALGGSEACVRALLLAGVDPEARTADGRTARDLAVSLGWPRVVALLDGVARA